MPSDRDLLRKCLEAFVSMGRAYDANQFLKKQGEQRKIYAGSGQHKLRAHMMDQLEQHLESRKPRGTAHDHPAE